MVAETESQTSGWALRICATTVLLPTPEGPESTVSRDVPTGSAGVSPGELQNSCSDYPG